MTVSDLLIRVRQRLGDMMKTKFSDEELVYSLNNAIDKLSMEYADQRLPDLISTFTVTGATATDRPDDFISTLGQYPIVQSTSNGKVVFTHIDPNHTGDMTVRYFAMRPNVSALTDTIPFYRQYQMNRLMLYTIMEVNPNANVGLQPNQDVQPQKQGQQGPGGR